MTDTVKVFQPVTEAVEKVIVLSPLHYEVNENDTTLHIAIRSNTDYELVIPTEAQEWITNRSTENASELTLSIQANPSAKEREASITVRNLIFDSEETISIKQTSMTALR